MALFEKLIAHLAKTKRRGSAFLKNLLRLRRRNERMRAGLWYRISVAKDAKTIDRLLAEGEDYKGASDKTRRHWQKAAVSRRKALLEETA